mmetsp:Transcript_65616/g.181170  ORF Transcript_65616/g.181170 Transcript_65616/m.181170 type:complete len:533 (-) Transcript_65616:124-1722(-)
MASSTGADSVAVDVMGGAGGEPRPAAPAAPRKDVRSDRGRAAAVCRVVAAAEGRPPGLGFLVRHKGKDCLLTNHHLVDTVQTAKKAQAQFHYTEGKAHTVEVNLDPDAFFRADRALDYSLCALKEDELAKTGVDSLNLPDYDTDVLSRGTSLTLFGGDPGSRAKRRSAHTVTDVRGPLVYYKHESADYQQSTGGAPVFREGTNLAVLHIGHDLRKGKDIGVQLCAVAAHLDLERVVKAMRDERTSSDAQIRGALALAFVAYRSDRGREAVVDAGGVEALVAAMKAHQGDTKVQEQCCGTLGNIAAGEAPECQDTIVEAGAIKQLVEAMNRNQDSPNVQEGAMRTMANVAVGQASRKDDVIGAGALEAIVRAMDKHKARAEVVEAGARVLATVAFGSDKRKDDVIAMGGTAAVVHAMKAHVDNEDVQESGCICLVDLSAGGGSRTESVFTAGGVDCIVAALETHPDHEQVQEYGLLALWNVAGERDHTKALEHEGARRCAQQALDRHADVPQVKKNAKALVKRLDRAGKCVIM